MVDDLGQLEHVSFRVSVGDVCNGQHFRAVVSTVRHQRNKSGISFPSVRAVCSSQLLSLLYLKM